MADYDLSRPGDMRRFGRDLERKVIQTAAAGFAAKVQEHLKGSELNQLQVELDTSDDGFISALKVEMAKIGWQSQSGTGRELTFRR